MLYVYLFPVLTVVFLTLSMMPQNHSMVARLDQIMGKKQTDEAKPTFKERILYPLVKGIAQGASKIAPHGQKDRTEAQLALASMEKRWSVEDWQGVKYGIALGGGAVAVVIAVVVHLAIMWRVEIIVMGFLISYIVPSFWLKHKGKARIEEIEKTMPDVLDLLTISVEAGLGFDAALLKVVEKGDGILTTEFLKVLQEIRMGKPRRDALRDLAKRNPAEDLKTWVAALVQADQLGLSMGGVMRNQAKQIRTKRRQRVEEKAQKAPVKVMIPLVLFIFPCVFIVVLGPAVISLMSLFGGN